MRLSRATARRLAPLPAGLALAVLATLGVIHYGEYQDGLLTSERLDAMRGELALDPNNASAKEAIREARLHPSRAVREPLRLLRYLE